MKIELPENVKYIINELNKNGHEAYIVGGCVRDALMGMIPHDWDVTTSAQPMEIKSIFKHTFDTGIKHGTVTIVLERINYEVTTYRVDGEYKDHRRPSVVTFTTNLTEDLRRRDFTMNAIAYSICEGCVDPFNGIGDISRRIIRGVGEPDRRFTEDALRMLRGVRFAVQLGFEIEPETYNALKKNIHLIEKISAERIREELTKLLAGAYIENMSLLTDSGLMNRIFPDYSNYFDSSINMLAGLLDKLDDKNPAFCYALFLSGLDANNGKDIMKRLKFDNKTINETVLYLKYINQKMDGSISMYELRRMMSETGSPYFGNILYLKRILDGERQADTLADIEKKYRQVTAGNACLSITDMNINGQDIRELLEKYHPEPEKTDKSETGRMIGRVLAYLFDSVLMQPELNDKDTLIKLACSYITDVC